MVSWNKNRKKFGARVVSVFGVAFLTSVASSEGQAQTQSITLDTIDVQSSRSGSTRAAPGEQGPPPAQQDQQSPYGPGQGYTATRSTAGTKTDTPISEIPQSISVVTSEAIRDQGAQSVQEALRYVPGVYADAYGPDTRSDGALIRGTAPVYYLDGMRLNNGGFWNHNRPDPFTLSRVEVLRGPGSVLYGNSPVGGLVNMVSKRPQEQGHHEIGVQYGSFDWKQIQADTTGKLTADGQWLYRVIGIFRDANHQTDFVKNDRQVFMPAITWQPTKDTNWTVIGLYQKDKTGSSTAFLPLYGTLFPNPNGQIPINRFASEPGFDLYQTTTKSVTSLFEHSFSNNFKVRANMRYAHTDGIYRTMYSNSNTNYRGALMPYFPYTDATQRSVHRIREGLGTSRDTFTADTGGQIDFATGPVTHKVLFGVDMRDLTEKSRQDTGLDINPFDLYNPVYGQPSTLFSPSTTYNNIRQQLHGIYLQDQARLGPWLITAGVRRDKLESEREGVPTQEESATTKRFGLMYETSFGLNPYVSYAESFEPILGANTCLTFCKPKRGTQYEAGFKYRVSDTAAFNAAVFDIKEKNRLAPGPTQLYSIQIGEAGIRGLELEYIGSITPDLDIMASYTYLDAKVTQGDFVGSRIESVPQNYASLWAKHKFGWFGVPGFSVGAGVRYIGESWSTGMSPVTSSAWTIATPDHTLFDAMFAYENKNWRLQVTGTNLADKIYFGSCLARGDCFYGNRRTVVGTLTYKF
jgi:iron complex outermembrane receptor protein